MQEANLCNVFRRSHVNRVFGSAGRASSGFPVDRASAMRLFALDLPPSPRNHCRGLIFFFLQRITIGGILSFENPCRVEHSFVRLLFSRDRRQLKKKEEVRTKDCGVTHASLEDWTPDKR